MAQIAIYKSHTWHDLIEHQNHWLGTGPLTMIVPEHTDKFHLAKTYPELNPNTFFTIPELIENYLKRLGGNGLISIHGLESILSESFASYLKIEKYKQGYVKALTDFIFNFRKTTIMDLQSAIDNFKKEDQLTLKEKDLIKIETDYEKKLPDYGFDLKSGLEKLLRNVTEPNIAQQFGINAPDRFIFFGFNFINPLEEEFIFTVFQRATEVTFLLCEDCAAAEPAVRIQKSIMALLKRSQNMTVEYQLPAQHRDNFFVTLANSVFHWHSGSNRKIAVPEQKLFLIKENNRFSEMISIARRIKLLSENGVSLKDIRVVTPDYQLYSSIIQEVFPEYGIAFSLENGVPLLRFPLATVILNLVNQSIHPNPYLIREKLFLSPYLSLIIEVKPSDLIKYQEAMGVELLPADKLNLFCRPARYRLDFRYTLNILKQAYRTVKATPGMHQLEVIKLYLDGLDWKSATARQKTVSWCLIQFYLRFQAEKSLTAWQLRMSGVEFKEVLLEILNRFNIEENIDFSNSPEFGIKERDAAILTQINNLLDEMIASLAPLSKASDAKFALLELVRIFSRLMNGASLLLPERGGVAVQPVNKGQYQCWDYSFICGLVDGEFPGTDQFNFLQPKKEGLSLGNAYTSVDHARNQFYHLIRSTTKALFLSRPLSNNGRKLPASPFIKEIEKFLSPEIHAAAAPFPMSDQLYSLREKLFFIGKNVDYNYPRALPFLKTIKIQDEVLFKKITDIMRYDGLVLNSAGFAEFDGVFSHTPASLALLNTDLDKITFTAAIFERYAACPLRFFFDDIMNLKSEPDYHPDLTEAGILIRTILKEYTIKAVTAEGIPDAAATLIRELIIRYFNDQHRDTEADAFQVRLRNHLLAGLGQPEAKRPGLFHAFLENEKNAPDLIRPYAGNLSGTIKLGTELEIRVEIDRVDITRTSDQLILFGYTTASTGNPGKILKGLRFDLPLAILWLSGYVTEQNLKLPVAGAGLYLVRTAKEIKRGGYFAKSSLRTSRQNSVSAAQPIFSGQRDGLITDGDFIPTLEKIKDRILQLYRLMKQGVFHLPLCDEADQSCCNCSFGRACRKEQLRLERLRINLRDAEDVNNIKPINQRGA